MPKQRSKKRHTKCRFFICLLFSLLLFNWPVQTYCLTGRLDINTATQQELQELPYIGKQRAEDIIRYRREHGAFTSLDDLLNVSNIGEKSLEAISPYLSIGSSAQSSKADTASFHKKITTRPGDIVTLPDEKYFHTLVDFIRSAKQTIDISMFLFKTTSSPKNKAALLLKELTKAKSRGVAIRVVLENSGYEESINKENQKVARKLRKNGIKVYFDSPDTTNHAKVIVIDNRYSFIGSHNLSHSALSMNHEFSLLIDNRNLAGELVHYIEEIR
ncbi:MAG: helix-hairpin-helix domain-containing protein [Desulfobulbaceae bacterium]|nr:helix-hairpin-helix domain-containing protein [Desulfobulbaceae bacterium]